MQGKIALEEHFAIPETLMDSAGFLAESVWPELKNRLLDIHDRRLKEMDEQGVEMMILSLNAPAVQQIPDAAKANEIAVLSSVLSTASSSTVPVWRPSSSPCWPSG